MASARSSRFTSSLGGHVPACAPQTRKGLDEVSHWARPCMKCNCISMWLQPRPKLASRPRKKPCLPAPPTGKKQPAGVKYCFKFQIGKCKVTVADCKFRHACEKCGGAHARCDCLELRKYRDRSPPLSLLLPWTGDDRGEVRDVMAGAAAPWMLLVLIKISVVV